MSRTSFFSMGSPDEGVGWARPFHRAGGIAVAATRRGGQTAATKPSSSARSGSASGSTSRPERT
jgi:hypothetical protein